MMLPAACTSHSSIRQGVVCGFVGWLFAGGCL
jgi:hypothetical protein